ncbi:1-acyl-sn-glycerol-3-phosphate acyltransferase [Bosea sp. (in: a-proteobacteria)]|uniref:lysophospholipid acyltransferase family protein n=1 Tax=Bosea sp. (in: a-proteobacteria) TaxID=1871050 RepID=UPI00261AA805|nr:lysophospholipid acyltransferase family protein [Bosea sp. (in: a-proteobacteria)]MCO5090480.1 1-acyl-sn-glycerol-3-phosphate acyltransferase [Bosea sp. (in: a-proteobacteria)]
MTGLRLGALARLATLCTGTLALVLAQLVVQRAAPRRRGALPLRFHRLTCWCLGVRRQVRGSPPPAGTGALIVANHVSWLDIGVIGAERELAFVAKSEVGTWPVVGFLADLQRTVYIDRQRRGATAGVAEAMGARIAAGEEVVLFAEGTTGDGTRILPFRSSLIGAAHRAMGDEAADVTVYPLTITYTGRQNLPGGRDGRAALAWYGDTELWPHLKHVLDCGAIDVELTWGEPIVMGRATSRKEAARLAEASVRKARRQAITGRPEPPAVPKPRDPQ